MKLELEVPEKYATAVELSTKEWKESFREAFLKALEEAIEAKLAFKSLKELAAKSKLTDEQVMELGEELKERIAKRHGLL